MSATEKNLKLFEDAIGLFTGERYDECLSLLAEIESSALPVARQAEYHGLMGDLYAHKGAVSKALESLSKAIEIDPEDPIPYSSRAEIYRSQQQATKYSEDMETAIRLSKLPKNKERFDASCQNSGFETQQAFLEAHYFPMAKGTDNLQQMWDSLPPEMHDPAKRDSMDPSERDAAFEKMLAAAKGLDMSHTETGAEMPKHSKADSASSTSSGSSRPGTPQPAIKGITKEFQSGCLIAILGVGAVIGGLCNLRYW